MRVISRNRSQTFGRRLCKLRSPCIRTYDKSVFAGIVVHQGGDMRCDISGPKQKPHTFARVRNKAVFQQVHVGTLGQRQWGGLAHCHRKTALNNLQKTNEFESNTF